MRQKIILILFTASAIMLAGCDNAQTAESTEEASSAVPNNSNKVALVIGNGVYTDDNWPKLRNAPNDAEAIAAALRRLGFIVTLKTNLVKKAMRIAISDFGTLATNAKVALFFYAGHGIQDNNQNYLIPVDGTGLDLADAIEGSVSFELLLRRLMHAKSQVNIVMLDACRTNTGFSRGQPGLANVSGSSGTVIFYATQPGNIAADRVSGGDHSPFTNGLLKAFNGQDLSLGEVLKFTSQQVKEKTGGQQIPYVNGPRDLDDFLLNDEVGQAQRQLISGRYQDNGDGTVTDVTTNLMWKRCSEGQTWDGNICTGEAVTMTWNDAMPNERQKSWGSFAGYNDWRLPNREELKSLVYCSSGDPKTWNDIINYNSYDGCNGEYQRPTIDQTAFPNTPYWFWTASPYAADSSGSWIVDFHYGDVYLDSRSASYAVRLVRVGQ